MRVAISNNAMTFSLLACVAGLAAACITGAPQTLAEVLVGKKWTCIDARPDPGVTGAVYVTYFSDGQSRTHFVSDKVEANGDVLHAEATIHGIFSVDGDNFKGKSTSAKLLKFTRNGVDQISSEAHRKMIEENILTGRVSLSRLDSWSANQVVWTGEPGLKQVCSR